MQQLERHEAYLLADPGNAGLLARVIDLCLAEGAAQRAADHVREALARFPDDPYFLGRQGHVFLLTQQWEQAAALFEALLKTSVDPHLAFNLAYARQMQGRYAEAWEALSSQVSAGEPTSAALTVAVRSLQHLGRHDEALALIGTHEARCQGDSQFLAAAALVYLDTGDLTQAERLNAAASAADHPPLEALVVGGSLALARTDSAAATAQFQAALARNPEEGRSWSGLGMASLLNHDAAEAQGQMEKAVKYMPGHIGSWHVLAWCKVLRSDLAGAEADFRTALELDRNFGESHGGLAVVHAMLGRRGDAEAGIERALRLDAQGLSARYAQMLLSGETADPARFRSLALRLLAGRKTADGQNLADVVLQHGH